MRVLLAQNPSVALALEVPTQNDMSDTKPMTLHTQEQAVTLFVEMVQQKLQQEKLVMTETQTTLTADHLSVQLKLTGHVLSLQLMLNLSVQEHVQQVIILDSKNEQTETWQMEMDVTPTVKQKEDGHVLMELISSQMYEENFEETVSTMELMSEMTEIKSMETAVVKTVRLKYQDLLNGSALAEMNSQQISAMNGVAMVLDMKIPGSITQEEIFSDFKKLLVMTEILDLGKAEMDFAELKKDLFEVEVVPHIQMSAKKNEEILGISIMTSETMEIWIPMMDEMPTDIQKWGGNDLEDLPGK